MSHAHTEVPSSNHLLAGYATRHGPGRTVNEDSLGLPDDIPSEVLARKGHLYIVADGVGGHQAGNVASQMAVEIIRRIYYNDPNPDSVSSLRRAIETANTEIHRQASSPAYAGMGTTVVVTVVQGDELVVANVGDSRAYLLQGGILQRLTSDHTWVAERVAAGILTSEEATRHDMRHIVTRSLGAEFTVEVDVRSHRLLPGDRLLLCSDGVWEPVPEAEMARLLGHRRPQAAAAALVNRATAAGGADDATALVVGAEPVRAGVLGQAGQAVEAVLASPKQWAVLGGIGAVVVLALLCGLGWRLVGDMQAVAPPSPTVPPTAMPSPTLTAMPTAMVSPTVPPTATPVLTTEPTQTSTTLLPSPTISSQLESGGYCISPVDPDDASPVKAFDEKCQIVEHLSVGTIIEVPWDSVCEQNVCQQPLLIRVVYQGRPYRIFPWRIGRWENGQCQPIPEQEWRDFFQSPRQ